MKIWQKGYQLNELIEKYTVGNDYLLDLNLVSYDCIASKAHAKMLHQLKVLKEEELNQLTEGLDEIIQLHKEGRFEIKLEDEDCHTAIENYLIKKLGETGKKIHTFRSRNDQVLTALRLYYKDHLNQIEKKSKLLIKELENLIKNFGSVAIPGFTHTRKAMPFSIRMWCSWLIESISDNMIQVRSVMELIDQSPLGSAAGYGVPIKIDRDMTAKELGFRKVQQSPIYVQNSRGKFEAAILQCLSLILFDLNKAATDLIFFTLPEFNFFNLPDHFLTGSSIMPQKKNPDVLELVRANYHSLVSLESQLKSMVANLISGYHRDFQLTKGPVMQGIEITHLTIDVMVEVFKELQVNEEKCKEAMTPELFATEKAYRLVQSGIPFRDAYRTVAEELFK